MLQDADGTSCNIGDLFQHLTRIRVDSECRAGCHGGDGQCDDDWYPGAADSCNADCGKIFEPFWDQCGDMLTKANMGGMDRMNGFYDNCIEELYPPGSCGTFCNQHTFECFSAEVHEACCDEDGENCVAGSSVPRTCPVGCALVFPEFEATCREHLEQNEPAAADYSAFAEGCMEMDGIDMIDYLVHLQQTGCSVDLGHNPSGQHRFLQLLSGVFNPKSSTGHSCPWEQVDDMANQVDRVCACGADGCANVQAGFHSPQTCGLSCAVAMHTFLNRCGTVVHSVLGDSGGRYDAVQSFRQQCLDDTEAHSESILQALKSAVCPENVALGAGHEGVEVDTGGARTGLMTHALSLKMTEAMKEVMTVQVDAAYADGWKDADLADCWLTPEEIAANPDASAFAADYVATTAAELGVPRSDIKLTAISTDGDDIPGCSYSQRVDAACTADQEDVIATCSDDCLACDIAEVQRDLRNCLPSDGNGSPAIPGVSFCKRGAACSPLQHAIMVRCMANCHDCDKEATETVLKICMADMDRIHGGTRAVDMIETTCAAGSPCSQLQEAIAARCMQNCLACDILQTGAVLGACTLNSDEAAIEMIDRTCSDARVVAVASPLDDTPSRDPGDSVLVPPPPPPPHAPACSLLQTSIAQECHRDCDICEVEKVREIIDNCLLDNGTPAEDHMCTHVGVSAQSQESGICKPVQQAVIRTCSNDCAGCDAVDVSIVLNGCSMNGVTQVVGVTFCAKAAPCNAGQLSDMANCLSECAVCDQTAILGTLGDCVVDDGGSSCPTCCEHKQNGNELQCNLCCESGGTRAATIVATQCHTGAQCSGLQAAVLAHCLRDCGVCDTRSAGSVLGTCTVEGHGSAMSMVSESCSAANVALDVSALLAQQAGRSGRPPPPPPPPPPACSSLQTAVADTCADSCAQNAVCDVHQVIILLNSCHSREGVEASHFLESVCSGAESPPPAPPSRCTSLQENLIDDCRADCLNCNLDDVERVLSGCTQYVIADGLSLIQPTPGVTFCVHEGTKCSDLQHGVLGRCLTNCEACQKIATKTVLADCRADTDKIWNGIPASDLVDTECETGPPCTGLQKILASQCVSNCDACDKISTGEILGMCSEDQHGTAIEFIEQTCSLSDFPGAETEVSIGDITGPATVAVPLYCTMLQSAIMTECHQDCKACQVDKVRVIIGDCLLETGSPARSNMCTHVAQTSIDRDGGCSSLQEAVIESCTNDCAGCSMFNTNTVLTGCTIDGLAQEAGGTFCIYGPSCSALQHSVLARCLSNCDACNKDSTTIVLGDCVTDHDVTFGGTRGETLVVTECATGMPCSPLQSAVLTHCVSDCDSCDRFHTGTVLGACTVEGQGSAVSMIHATCAASAPLPPLLAPPGDASSTMPPPGPPACSMLQKSVMSECQRDCSACSVGFSRSFIRQCVLGDGSRALDNMCTHVAAPPPPTAHVCGAMQLMLIAHCRDECDNCDMESVTSVLAGCTVQGVTQEKGVTFCTLDGGQMDSSISVVEAGSTTIVTPVVTETQSDSITGMGFSTYRLSLKFADDDTGSTVYKIYGTQHHPLIMPPAYQVRGPAGSDVGTNPQLWGMSPDAAYDSWLTVGAVDISDMGSSVMHHGQWQPVSTSNYIGAGGIDFRTWTEANGLRVENGDVSWADPSSAPSCDDRQSNGCTIAQLTVPSQGHFTAIVNAEGYLPGQGKWTQEDIRFEK